MALIILAGGIGNTIGSLFGVRLTGRMTPAQAIYLSAAVMGIATLMLAASPAPIFVGLVFLPLFACGGRNAQRPYAPPAATRQHSHVAPSPPSPAR